MLHNVGLYLQFAYDGTMIFNFDLQFSVFSGFCDKIATYLWTINVVFFMLWHVFRPCRSTKSRKKITSIQLYFNYSIHLSFVALLQIQTFMASNWR